MKVKAAQLRSGQLIRIEYGLPDNIINFTVDRIEQQEKMVIVFCSHGSIKGSPAYRLDEEVEVISCVNGSEAENK